ncbi:DUF930 domain-containing protein [Mesorhizobium sp.]|uniref:DUF930 domain-containing protein n=1 Tax=Mesorhizobium sp. TaxID=1871066 RepID=UPI000FE653DA|nr:DUF930 domain-containing protein [Mesorhizobium sp.]RWC58359.1 MAG: DUF930 domain-containing protein [Mesorhizobium sp.]RWC59433.1 MAG: DUF930 domain-containing protein [Mesorhizobium sp.]
MKSETGERRRHLLWALPASLVLHALIAAFLVYGLPVPPQQPQEEQPVNVALVPPPDQPKPKPAPAPPPKKAEKPPEPKVEKPPEQKVEKPPPPEKQAQKSPPIEVLKPVFQFGEKDAGPRKSLDGASAQDSSPSPTKDDASKPPVVPKPEENKSAELTPDAEKQATSTEEMDKQQADKQKPEAHDADKQEPEASPTPLAAGEGEIELPMSAEAPKPKPANAPNPGPSKASKSGSRSAGNPSSTDVAVAKSRLYSGLPGVRKLYSQGATGDALATTSMAGVPRGKRAAKLCASALQQQLLDASYFPELIPSVPLKAGNILDAPDVAFRTTTTWYHLGFRCEVDTDATRVLSFNFRVGPVIPPDQWVRLGLPVR